MSSLGMLPPFTRAAAAAQGKVLPWRLVVLIVLVQGLSAQAALGGESPWGTPAQENVPKGTPATTPAPPRPTSAPQSRPAGQPLYPQPARQARPAAVVQPVIQKVSVPPPAEAKPAAAMAGPANNFGAPVTPRGPVAAAAIKVEGQRFQVSRFAFEYAHPLETSGLPDLRELDNLKVTLCKTSSGYIAPVKGASTVELRLGDLSGQGPQYFYASGILQVNLAAVQYFNERHGLVGVYISPHPQDIQEQRAAAAAGEKPVQTSFLDLRGGRTTMREVVMLGVVSQMRTIASGTRVRDAERMNNRVHQKIAENSPVKALAPYRAVLLDNREFAGELSRQRRVDAKSNRPFVALVGNLRTSGQVADQSYEYPASIWSREDARAHAQAFGARLEEVASDSRNVIDKKALDEYVNQLNRQPGRHVDMAVAAAGEGRGEVGLDYLVAETKPWLLYTQYSNTGTRQTNESRLRFGFIDNQLTNNDDVLDVDYSTACFDNSNIVIAKYNAPISWVDKLRWEAKLTWDEFNASDLGEPFASSISGHGFTFGANLIYNVFQHQDFFLDVVAGADWRHIYANNPTLGRDATLDYLLPRVGVQAQQTRETSNLFADLNFEWAQPDVGGGDLQERNVLGRVNTDDFWHLWYGSAAYSFYLEPLLAPAAFADPSSRWATLANEIMVGGAWQYAPDNRLIPNSRMVAGGLYSVRGYPESIVAGDSAVFAQTEYRYHVPRAFNPGAAKDSDISPKSVQVCGKDFKYLPQHPYGQADWDLILKAFFDVARTVNTDRIEGLEQDETLAGTGLGVELKLYQNASIRLDWGVPLISTKDDQAKAGVQRLHAVVTLVY